MQEIGFVNEDNLWDWLRDVALPLGHYSRIESPDTAPGFPDVHYQIAKRERRKNMLMTTRGKMPMSVRKDCSGTIELKCNMTPATVPFPNEEKGLHRSQLKWIRDEIDAGGIVWIIAETPGVIYIIHGKDARKFNGADHQQLIDIAWQTISRDDPEQAVTLLHATLGAPSNFHLLAEHYP